MNSRTRRNTASARTYARNLTDVALTMTRKAAHAADEEERGEVLQRLAGLRPELEAARAAIDGLLGELEDVDEEALAANRQVRTPAVLTRTPDRD